MSTEAFAGQVAETWEHCYSCSAQGMTESIITQILKLANDPEIISFSGGMPAPELFPVAKFQEAAQHVLATNGQQALQYSSTVGYEPLRTHLAERMSAMGVPSTADNILIVNGSQQALDLVGRLFLDPDDVIVTGNPTYLGALQSWCALGARYVTVPVDEDGMCVEALPKVLASQRAKFIYVLPNFHNPVGVTLTAERRRRLAEISAEQGVIVLEDDPYGALRYSGEPVAPVASYDPSRVMYLSTFSKTLSPGIRLGWITAPRPIITKLAQIKQGADLHTSPLLQMIALELYRGDFLARHLETLCDVYRRRRDAMLSAMARHFPAGVTWTKPEGGLFLWVELPAGQDAMELFKIALQEKVAFVPGQVFYPNGDGENTLRLNFSLVDADTIEIGIKRLGGVFAQALA